MTPSRCTSACRRPEAPPRRRRRSESAMSQPRCRRHHPATAARIRERRPSDEEGTEIRGAKSSHCRTAWLCHMRPSVHCCCNWCDLELVQCPVLTSGHCCFVFQDNNAAVTFSASIWTELCRESNLELHRHSSRVTTACQSFRPTICATTFHHRH